MQIGSKGKSAVHVGVEKVKLEGTRWLTCASGALQLLMPCLHPMALPLLQPRVGREVELCGSPAGVFRGCPAVLPGPDRAACCCSSEWRR